jgi:hypothetical protein
MIADLLHRVTVSGEEFAGVFADWMPMSEAQMLAAIYMSKLDGDRLRKLAGSTQRTAKLNRKFISSMIPIVGIALGIVGMLYYMSTQVFPSLLSKNTKIVLTGQALAMKEVGDFFAGWGGPVVLVFALIVPIGVAAALPRLTGPVRTRLDTVFPFSVYRDLTGTSWLRALAILLSAGLREQQTHDALLLSASPYMRERLDALLEIDHLPLAAALDTTGLEWPHPSIRSGIETAMQAREPAIAIGRLAETWGERMEERLDALVELATVASTFAIGGLLFWLLLVTRDLTSSLSH